MNKILQGDCLSVMKTFPDNYFSTIITDPPYGLSAAKNSKGGNKKGGFMGQKWDYDVPSVEIWTEALRVLKPGGTALIFAGSRTQHRMAVNVEDAGFILKDTIMWVYASGFPKAHNISKNIDKKAGAEREVIGKKEGTYSHKTGTLGSDAEKNRPRVKLDITEPSTPEAKLWDGWKSHGLKPSYEPILVCMKPNEGSYADNALKWGVSGLNIDECRVGTNDEDKCMMDKKASKKNNGINFDVAIGKNKGTATPSNPQGRFPANFIHDGSEEVVELFPNTKTGNIKPFKQKSKEFGNLGENRDCNFKGDSGSAARFFYCAKVSKAERNIGCEDMEKKGYHCSHPLEGKKQKQNENYDEVSWNVGKSVGSHNNHPTVKPIKLMEYLCKLTSTPTGGIVLDPFAGSGSTGLACQNTNRDFILIEREQEYIDIIHARLNGNIKEEMERSEKQADELLSDLNNKQNTIWDI